MRSFAGKAQPLAIGVDRQCRFRAALLGCRLIGFPAVDGEPDSDVRIAGLVVGRQLVGFEIDRFLLAAVGTVAHQSFADDMAGDDDLAFTGGERLQVRRRGLGGVVRLKVKSSAARRVQSAASG